MASIESCTYFDSHCQALKKKKKKEACHVCSCEPCETIITHPLEEKANCWCYRSVIKQKGFGSLGVLRGTPCARCAVPLVQLWDRHIRTLTHTLTASLYCSSLRVISCAVLKNPLGMYSGKKGWIPVNVQVETCFYLLSRPPEYTIYSQWWKSWCSWFPAMKFSYHMED